MYKLRGCPICGNPVEIKIVLKEYGFNGVIIECPNCKCGLRDGKCSEQINKEDIFATPVTESSLAACLFRAIALWNHRCKRANEEDIGEPIRKDAEDWMAHRKEKGAEDA